MAILLRRKQAEEREDNARSAEQTHKLEGMAIINIMDVYCIHHSDSPSDEGGIWTAVIYLVPKDSAIDGIDATIKAK